ncbi:restriction endonuclease subunit S [Priestia flexa]|uniref:restriction endonuclease subunit S n=1 Tax=Priestia flexa TaxID=86664 RepID=UPI003D8F6CA8
METELTLDEIVSFEKTYSFSRSIEGEGEYRHIHYGDIHTKLPSIIENSEILPEITEEDNFKVIQKGDILVADASEDYKDLGKAVCYMGNDEKVIAGLHTHLLRCNKEMVNPEYLINLFQTNRYKKFVWRMGTGVSVLGLSKNNLGKYEIFLPTLEEQKKKANFFNILNKKIQLQQQKIDLLQEQKKGFLQKMFPKAGEKQPQVRFAGFTDDWEQRKFGEIITERREKTKIENEDTLLSSAIDGMYLNSELFSHFRGKSNIGYLKIRKNDMILSAQNLHLGNCNINQRFEHGIISPAYKVYSLVNVDAAFMHAWIKKDSTKQFFENATTEGASVCRKNIEWGTLYSQKIYIPIYSEQQKIGELFNVLDRRIQLQQQKLELLQKQKKGFMQKMFI